MIRLLADENFNGDINRGLRQRDPEREIVRVQDTEIAGAVDPAVLAWAAREGRILLTHDVSTIPGFAYERVGTGATMPGVVVVGDRVAVGHAVEEITILLECSLEGELENQVRRLPR